MDNIELTRRVSGVYCEYDSALLKMMVDREVAAFESEKGNFDRVSWLLDGLGYLADAGEALHLTVPAKKYQMRTMDALWSAFGAAREAALAEGNDADIQRMIRVTEAWLNQSEYLIWARARAVEEYMLEATKEKLLDLLRTPRDFATIARKTAERWSTKVWAWHAAFIAGSPDPFAIGKDA